MSNVLTFTRIFPEYHIRKGEPTYFVEQILNNLISQNIKCNVAEVEAQFGFRLFDKFRIECGSKGHTVRSGNDWKVGDQFSPGIWLDKPYVSKIITIAPDMKIKKIWTFECSEKGVIAVDGSVIDACQEEEIAKNDGLSLIDFKDWIVMPCRRNQKSFKGQIICWDDSIVY
ncbi:MAG: hypothetical protein P0Y49_06285 [Candidatus Pedobacter colombiensis]|uniref:Uncharacterized protein n=1 Tax=Candidatus Pedobacter colombiensis TaxID=3121371 RepID=A0AAJ5WDN6_9SPHI|nr:hypothetical protein [Pedobacter sp.]WEK20742.1 MAG: hypothetical protein P0Y49_06285 [Pedobacter sp.]